MLHTYTCRPISRRFSSTQVSKNNVSVPFGMKQKTLCVTTGVLQSLLNAPNGCISMKRLKNTGLLDLSVYPDGWAECERASELALSLNRLVTRWLTLSLADLFIHPLPHSSQKLPHFLRFLTLKRRITTHSTLLIFSLTRSLRRWLAQLTRGMLYHIIY